VGTFPAVLPLHDNNPTTRPAIVTILVLVLCTAVYFFVQPTPFSDTSDDAAFLYRHAAIPAELRARHPLDVCQLTGDASLCAQPVGAQKFAPAKNLWFALIASMFLHASLWHLAGNMLFLWVFGNNVEDRLGHLGFAAFYLAAGLVAAAAYCLVNINSTVPVIGASGAIAGVMGAYLVWFPRARVWNVILPFFFLPFPLPAAVVLVIWFLLQFVTDPNSGVAWVAHVAGFLFGVGVGFLVGPQRRPATSIR
jgi:membrane associated rhomboid family serine protease